MTSFPRGVAHPAARANGRGASLPDDGFGLSGDTGSLPRAGDRKPPYGLADARVPVPGPGVGVLPLRATTENHGVLLWGYLPAAQGRRLLRDAG
jgi:hypothetical protein